MFSETTRSTSGLDSLFLPSLSSAVSRLVSIDGKGLELGWGIGIRLGIGVKIDV